MLHPDLNEKNFENDYKTIKSYLERIKKYSTLIIDIRGNGGRDSKYWTDFLMPLIVKREYSQKYYSFIKEGDLLKNIVRHYNFKKYTDKSKIDIKFPKETLETLDSFSYFTTDTLQVIPHKDSIKFKGEIYLLVDRNVFSSSEMLAFFAKETKIATLIGERTAGDGIGTDPMLIDLPNSGFVLRFTKEMGVTEMGSINELDKTEPNIVLPNLEKKIKFDCNNIAIINNDKAIMAVIQQA